MKEKSISEELLGKAYDYKGYRDMLAGLIEDGKTTGTNQDDWLVDYARLNLQRMNRLDKTWKISDDQENRMLSIDTPLTWLTITEGWCGDAAQIIPVIEKLAVSNPLIDHKLILRDENLELMDQFLTNGTRSIPKTIIMETETKRVLASWGPRPSGAADLLKQLKANPDIPKEEMYNQLHGWYAKDKGRQTASEFLHIVETALETVKI